MYYIYGITYDTIYYIIPWNESKRLLKDTQGFCIYFQNFKNGKSFRKDAKQLASPRVFFFKFHHELRATLSLFNTLKYPTFEAIFAEARYTYSIHITDYIFSMH